MTPPYTLIEAIRTLRTERDWPFEQARDAAIEQFRRLDYELPSWARSAK